MNFKDFNQTLLELIKKHNNMNQEQQVNKLREITNNENYFIKRVAEVLEIGYSTAAGYFKIQKKSQRGYNMGNKIPLEFITKLCLHYGKPIEWFLY
jgi:DNA integrity scanning protein DisA with diadenylate cyclase activity